MKAQHEKVATEKSKDTVTGVDEKVKDDKGGKGEGQHEDEDKKPKKDKNK